jgi:peptide/nickel transport system substrate-binding protein
VHTRRLALLLLAVGLVLSGCGGTARTEVAGGAPDPDATVTVRLVLEPTSLDLTRVAGVALGQVLLDNVYQTLLTRTDDQKIVPLLAATEDTSPDGLTYTFRLHPEARFADGSPLTSADVAWSLDRARAADSVNPRARDLAAIASIATPDPRTVVITLRHRDTGLRYALTNSAGAVLKKGTDPATLGANPNGSGPFVVRQWQRGASITLSRNERYWGKAAEVASVVLLYIPDFNAANNAELTGDTDVEVTPLPTLLDPIRANPAFTISQGITSDKYTLGMNNTRGPLADLRVRRAIRGAIDKDGLNKILGGTFRRIGSGVAPTDPWFRDLTSIDPYDPASAKALLAQAGCPNGLKLNLTVPDIYPSTIGEYVVSQLKQVGITVTFRPVEFASWLDKVFTQGDFDLSIVDHAEARDIGNYANPRYYWHYDSRVVQDLYQRATTAATDGERDALLEQAASQVSEDAASDWLLNPSDLVVLRRGITGFPTSGTSSRLNLSQLAATAKE